MRVALVQMSIVDGEPDQNLGHAEELMRASPKADLYVLPELWTTGYAHEVWSRVADADTPRILGHLQRLSREWRAYMAGSMITRREDGCLVNRLWIVGPDARDTGFYDKGHLFAPMAEDRYLAAGMSRVRHRLNDWTVSLSICFDLRFPEMYRRDAVDGAEFFLVVAEWPHPRCEILWTLARARAMENQAFLALCNRTGSSRDGTQFCGGSALFDPNGTLLADAGTREGVFVATVSREVVESVRASLPMLRLHNPEVDG